MLSATIEMLLNEAGDCLFGTECADPRFRKSISEGVCPLCDSALDHSPEWLARLAIPCSSPVCGFVLKPHGRPSRNSH